MSINKLKPYFNNADIDSILEKVSDILKGNGYLTMGEYGKQFEEEFAEYNGNKYAITCNSGTSALEIICRSLDLTGYEVIIPSNTFIATANAIIGAGAKPIFADICYDMSLDPKSVLRNITKRTKAIMTVHIGGYVSPKIYELQEICNRKNMLNDKCIKRLVSINYFNFNSNYYWSNELFCNVLNRWRKCSLLHQKSYN